MADPLVLAAAGSAGAAVAIGIAGAAWRPRKAAAERWLERRRAPAAARPSPLAASPISSFWPRLTRRFATTLGPDLARAAWSETPERLLVGIALSSLAAALTVAGASTTLDLPAGPALTVCALAAPPLLWWRSLLAAGRRRRERLAAEAAPLLELLCLELGGGASLGSALESVAARLNGELVRDLRPLLVGARVSGGQSLQERLDAYADLHRLPALKSLAALCAMSRDYGSGAAQGARALAADLRREQRRRLIVVSRRALNRVLIPSAIGILLPFIGVLLFPAVVTLLRNLS
jgi:Flp pilus assembly protein TadB